MIDPETELLSSSEGLLVYNYRLVNVVDTIVDPNAVATLRSRIADSACATLSTRDLIDHKVTSALAPC
jgi:hypothetical protein